MQQTPTGAPADDVTSHSDTLHRQATLQHGLITHSQLRKLGISRSTIKTRLAEGTWAVMETSVLAVTTPATAWEQRLLAAALSIGPDAVASHWSAAQLWGLTGPDDPRDRLELSVPRTCGYRRPHLVLHRRADLHLAAAVNHRHIPTTPVARTLLDLGAVARRSQVSEAVGRAVDAGLVSWADLWACLSTHARRGRDGVATLRTVLGASASTGPER